MRYVQPFGVVDTNASYINGNPVTGTEGSIPPAAAFEHPQREIIAVITGAGLSPDPNDLTQLRQAILLLIAGATTAVPDRALIHYGTAGGAANVITLTTAPVMTSYAEGSTVIFVPAADNTSLVTINVSGLGTRNLRRSDGSANLVAGDLRQSRIAVATYDGTVFRLHDSGTGLPIIAVTDAGTADVLSGPGVPALSAWQAGQTFLVTKGANANAGTAPTLNVDGKGAKTIVRRDGAALASGDLPGGGTFLAVYDGTNVRLVGIVASEVAAGSRTIITNNFIVGGRISQYATPGTSVKNIPAGTPFEIEQCRGAGGGGGGSASTSASASGGGGGGVARGIYLAVTDVSLTINVGAGGPGGAGGGATNGTSGDTTSVVVTTGTVQRSNGSNVTAGNTLCSATGGGFGYGSASGPQTSQFGAGGTATGGDVNDNGAAGGFAYATGAAYVGGSGGSSPSGGGATPGPNVGFAGIAGNSPGGGGNGSSANGAGGAGAPGRVVIRS